MFSSIAFNGGHVLQQTAHYKSNILNGSSICIGHKSWSIVKLLNVYGQVPYYDASGAACLNIPLVLPTTSCSALAWSIHIVNHGSG